MLPYLMNHPTRVAEDGCRSTKCLRSLRNFECSGTFSPIDCLGQSCRALDNYRRDASLNLRRIWQFVEGDPVNDGVIFWTGAVGDDLAVKILSDTPAGSVLYGYRIDETS